MITIVWELSSVIKKYYWQQVCFFIEQICEIDWNIIEYDLFISLLNFSQTTTKKIIYKQSTAAETLQTLEKEVFLLYNSLYIFLSQSKLYNTCFCLCWRGKRAKRTRSLYIVDDALYSRTHHPLHIHIYPVHWVLLPNACPSERP